MKISITTLSENTCGIGDLIGEWGLSILIETDTINVLFDTGKSISATYNANELGIDLSSIDKIVLSHSHADHTGGLREVLQRIRRSEVEVIAHPDVWALRYRIRPYQADQFAGIPFQRQELENFGAVFNLTVKPMKLTDNIITTGEIPMVTDFETIDSGDTRFIKEDTEFRLDEILDDRAIIINTEQGLVVITGCAHRGIINTLYHAQQITGVKIIHTLIGGSHLFTASEHRIRRTIMALKDLNIQRLGLCHCTGLPAITLMAQEFGDKFFFNNAGTRINIPQRTVG